MGIHVYGILYTLLLGTCYAIDLNNTEISQCTESQKYLCDTSRRRRGTAVVWQSNDASNPYRCTEQCSDGCCYVYDPKILIKYAWGWLMTAGAVVVGVLIVLSLVMCAILYSTRIGRTTIEQRRCFRQFIVNIVAVAATYGSAFTLLQLGYNVDASSQFVWQSTLVPYGWTLIALNTGGLIAITVHHKLNRTESMPKDDNGNYIDMYDDRIPLLRTITMSGNEVQHAEINSWKRFSRWFIRSAPVNQNIEEYQKVKMTRSPVDSGLFVAGAWTSLVLLMIMPVVSGYDGFSGIAFKDVNNSYQSLALNRIRYTVLQTFANTILNIVLGLLTTAPVGLMSKAFTT